MAAAITTTSTTLEGQFVEISIAIQNAEKVAAETNPEFVDVLTLAVDAEEGAITVSATMPATIGGTAGDLTLSPQPFLP